jgi:CheY-like chemotaxis protein
MTSQKTPMRLLLVEDHPDIRDVLSLEFKMRGYEVRTADSIASALALAAEHRFDFVLCDWSLPDGSAAELMRELKARYKLRGLAMSAYTEKQLEDQWVQAGFDALLDKCADIDLIGKTVEEFAEDYRRTPMV